MKIITVSFIKRGQLWSLMFTSMLYVRIQSQPASSAAVTINSLKNNQLANPVEELSFEAITRNTEPSIADYCQNNNFHPADIFAKIENLNYIEDCLVICRDDKQCQGILYVKNFKLCYLKGSSYIIGRFNAYFKGLNSKHCKPYDIKYLKERKEPTELDHGSPPKVCGQPTFPFAINKRPKRIIAGGQPTFYSLPWMVYVKFQDDDNNIRDCGGSIIVPDNIITATSSSLFVLTAAHCVWDDKDEMAFHLMNFITPPYKATSVHAGTFDLRFVEAHEQVSRIEMAYVHPDYNAKQRGVHDLAVLRLKEPFKFNHYVRPICLPAAFEHRLNKTCENLRPHYIAGWGDTAGPSKTNKNSKSDAGGGYLKAAEVSLLKCSKAQAKKIVDNFIYAVAKNSINGGICAEGDSGGPMFSMDPTNKRCTIQGVVSTGQSQIDPFLEYSRHYNKFTRVSFYREWIDQIMHRAPNVPRKLYFQFPE